MLRKLVPINLCRQLKLKVGHYVVLGLIKCILIARRVYRGQCLVFRSPSVASQHGVFVWEGGEKNKRRLKN
jgi:hypothetical protein